MRAKAARERNENKFLFLWKAINGPELKREHRFHSVREWRCDFAHTDTQVAIEIEGGTWSKKKKSRHSTGLGFSDDCKKYNAANLCGWTVFRLTSDMITLEHVEPIRDHISGILIERSHS